jgi:hypothetical protein
MWAFVHQITERSVSSTIGQSSDHHHSHVAHIGVRGTGADQPIQLLEEVIGIVAAQVIGRVQAARLGLAQQTLVEDRPGRIGGSVLAIGAAREEHDAPGAVGP